MPTQRFDFPGANGQRLSGRFDLPNGTAKAYALFAHCFTCSKNSLAAVRIARALTTLGVGVLRFDFTGLGESEGDFAETNFSGNVTDLIAAAEQMRERGDPPSLLIGHSLGGAAVLAGASALPDVKAVVTIGAPFDVHHVTEQFGDRVDEILKEGEARVDLGGRSFTVRRSFIEDLKLHDQRHRIASLGRPLLILQSPDDKIVDPSNAAAIFAAANYPKSLVSLDGADHLLLKPADTDYVAELVATWSSRYLVGSKPAQGGDPGSGARVHTTGVGRLQLEVLAGGARFLADEPTASGGLGTGPSPYDLLCSALASCTAMTLRLYAAQKGWDLAHVEAQVSHAKIADQTPPDVFTRTIVLSGQLDDVQRARLMEIAARCPVHRTLERGSRIDTVSAKASKTV